ncbi:bifunctional hydroxymethylpyrimidine kinase/phosphomethylpyrimidine kinase [Asticcacaulis sp. BYS171W]|uniref:hydroxymethylpyrimidine kinase n=1 Tax=Asticcacaulis aquaticus TaxID=2984212 RepID=A0ABT5HQW7_9CAUL|nr:bifunctional hydroxymethylpyrimidine kinase/phosphomethylpyrimidine kinase [Asticcacaulis aquaticus]MDC7682439.1 bifunctional hydroxymethylpyrimidine kinase/phosphomethylpyrimidine kinase [Asticcacaulis aquaticus]
MRRVLIIAGSDPSGGAGIQADLKAVTCLGGYGMTAITALTVQNTLGVTDVMPVPEAIITAQGRACLSDIGADAIKTGMLGTIQVVETVAALIDEAPDAFVVVDPVMVAKGGHPLLPSEAISAIRSVLIPRAGLLTPNAPEAAVLTGIEVVDEASQRKAGEALLELGAKAVLMKGGHIDGDEVVDWLMTPDGGERYSAKRVETRHTHGTGCTLASACATLITTERPLSESVGMARDYVLGAILMAPNLGHGHGPLRHNWVL